MSLTKLSPMLNMSFNKLLLLKTQHPFCYISLKRIRLILLYVMSYSAMLKQCITTPIVYKLSHALFFPASAIPQMHTRTSLSRVGGDTLHI